ncbi:MAG: RsmB/NOP family class I SAM-dependent RNA methyltransferase [bacterium]
MPPTSLAGHILELLEALQRDARPADRLIDFFFRNRRYLGSHDRREIAECVYGILRHRRFLQTLIATIRSEAALSPAWLFAAFKLHIEKVSVQILQSFSLPIPPSEIVRLSALDPIATTTTLAERLSFPDWLVLKLQEQMGETECERLLHALNEPPPLTLRVNSLRTERADCLQELQRRGFECRATRFSPDGIHLARRSNLFSLDLFRAGWFELQDEGSQIVSLLLDPRPTWRIADVCAGGGGKTLHLAALMKNRGEIIASDLSRERLDNLQKRTRRSGIDNVRVMDLALPEKRKSWVEKLDAVLIDAPCSGTGVLRRNPDAKWKVTPEMVQEMAKKQKGILRDYATLVKPAGRLVYATCSLLVEENDDVVQSFLREHPDFHSAGAAALLQRYGLAHLAAGECLRLSPHQHGCDGFYAAVLQRDSSLSGNSWLDPSG